jgi:hypothetical protein
MTKKLLTKYLEECQYIPLDNKDGYFYTFDLGLSAALISAGFKLVSLDKTNLRKVQFIFNREAGIADVIDEYWTDRLEVKARAFFENTKMIKNRLYSE